MRRVDLHQRHLDKLDVLGEKTATSEETLLVAAINLLLWSVEQDEQGRMVVAVEKDFKTYGGLGC